jgi:hypothetical protein
MVAANELGAAPPGDGTELSSRDLRIREATP